MKKIFVAFVALFVVTIATPIAHADWRDDFQKVFEGTSLQETDQKLRDKIEEVQESGKIEEAKEKAKEVFDNTKDWIAYKYNNRGKHIYLAQGFVLSHDSNFTNKIDGAYLTVKIGAVKNTLYFSDRDGNPLSSFYWNDLATAMAVKYRFQQIAANGKIRTKGLIETFTGKNLFPDSSYYVWAELELASGEKIFRPVPVSKEDFKILKKSPKGTEFTPLFEK